MRSTSFDHISCFEYPEKWLPLCSIRIENSDIVSSLTLYMEYFFGTLERKHVSGDTWIFSFLQMKFLLILKLLACIDFVS